MKKILAMILVAALLLALSACAAPPEEGIVVSGKEVKITFVENLTTGYGWVFSMANPNAAVVKYVSDQSVNASGKETVGEAGFHIFVFNGNEAGTCEIKFELVRQWEEEIQPTETKTVTIEVDGNGNIVSAKEV